MRLRAHRNVHVCMHVHVHVHVHAVHVHVHVGVHAPRSCMCRSLTCCCACGCGAYRDVREREIGPPLQDDIGGVAMCPLTQVLCILDSLGEDLRGRGVPIDQADVTVELLVSVELDVLADQDPDADTAHVELIEEGVDLRE